MLEPCLRCEDPVPWVPVLPVEGCRKFGMQITDGQCLEAAGGDSSAQLLRLEIKLLQPHLVVEFIEGDGADENSVALVLDQGACMW